MAQVCTCAYMCMCLYDVALGQAPAAAAAAAGYCGSAILSLVSITLC